MDDQHTEPTPAAAKKELRGALWATRKELARRPKATRTAEGEEIARHGLALVRELVAPGGLVTSYESWPTEPGTAALNAALLEAGYRVIVPVTLADLDLDWQDLPDPQGPSLGREAIGEADLVLTPGTAVDPSGVRLGQGGGCYDRALTRKRPEVQVVTLLHPHELVAEPLPRAPHDQLVNAVLTAEGVTWLSPGRSA